MFGGSPARRSLGTLSRSSANYFCLTAGARVLLVSARLTRTWAAQRLSPRGHRRELFVMYVNCGGVLSKSEQSAVPFYSRVSAESVTSSGDLAVCSKLGYVRGLRVLLYSRLTRSGHCRSCHAVCPFLRPCDRVFRHQVDSYRVMSLSRSSRFATSSILCTSFARSLDFVSAFRV